MSIKIMSAVWEFGPPKQAERFVLLALADYANDDGECWPSIAGIQRKTCMSERGVQTIIRRLEVDGWVTVSIGNGRKNCNNYKIQTPQDMHPAPYAPTQETPHMKAKTPHMTAINPAGYAPEPSLTIKEPSVSEPVNIKRAKARGSMPNDATISDAMLIEAEKRGHGPVEATAQFAKFKDSALANGRTYVDWDAAWRNWLTSPYFKISTGTHNGNGNSNIKRRDPALEQIARLTGLSATSGDGGL